MTPTGAARATLRLHIGLTASRILPVSAAQVAEATAALDALIATDPPSHAARVPLPWIYRASWPLPAAFHLTVLDLFVGQRHIC